MQLRHLEWAKGGRSSGCTTNSLRARCRITTRTAALSGLGRSPTSMRTEAMAALRGHLLVSTNRSAVASLQQAPRHSPHRQHYRRLQHHRQLQRHRRHGLQHQARQSLHRVPHQARHHYERQHPAHHQSLHQPQVPVFLSILVLYLWAVARRLVRSAPSRPCQESSPKSARKGSMSVKETTRKRSVVYFQTERNESGVRRLIGPPRRRSAR